MPNFKNHPPLFLPPGSVRAILAAMVIAAFVVSSFIDSIPKEAFAALGTFAGMVLGYYFKAREIEQDH